MGEAHRSGGLSESQPSNRGGCSTAINHEMIAMLRTREALKHGNNMAMAIAMFPLRVASMANELRRILELQQTADESPESKAVVGYIVDRIKKEYREMFGAELGQ